MALKEKNILRHQRREYCATRIQAVWRGCIASDDFIQAILYIISVQAFIRRKLAIKHKIRLRHERRERCAILIQAAWRGCIASDAYIQDVSNIILVQSLTRRKSAVRNFGQIKEERHQLEVASSTKIAAAWRKFYAAREYAFDLAGKSSRIVLFSSELLPTFSS